MAKILLDLWTEPQLLWLVVDLVHESTEVATVATVRKQRKSIRWPDVLPVARQWVHDQGITPTLRQIFYALVSTKVIPNDVSAYKALSRETAKARRAGDFPDLEDGTREIEGGPGGYEDLAEFWDYVKDWFSLDDTEGQQYQVWVVVEKRGLVAQVLDWIGGRGWSVVALGGYGSQTIADDIQRAVARDGRPAILLYLGDYDPSGRDIQRDFEGRTDCWDQMLRVALTRQQIREHNLPLLPGKPDDPRAVSFAADNAGELFQVEIDALPPTTLRDLLLGAGEPYWDRDAWRRVQRREAELQERLEEQIQQIQDMSTNDDEEEDDDL